MTRLLRLPRDRAATPPVNRPRRSAHNSAWLTMTMTLPTYYDILGAPRNADAITIRKSYLRSSLRCHPDKNPGREEHAKAEFIRVGQAYAVLSDEGKRAAYDRELDWGYSKGSGRPSSSSQARPSPQQQQQRQQQQQQQQQQYQSHQEQYQSQQQSFSRGDNTASKNSYDACNRKKPAADQDEFDTFMRMFDETVSGMSSEELNRAIGAAAVVGSIIGSILGARAVKNPLLANAASIVGSAVASQAASRLVQTIHEDSQQRMIERGERDAAIARGETVQGPSMRESRERVFQNTGRAFQNMASAAMGGSGAAGTSVPSSARQFSATVGVRRQGQFSWRQAAEVVKMAVDICSDLQQSGGGGDGGVSSRKY